MSIYVGTNEIKNVYVGTTPVKEIFVGTTKVRPSGWQPGANTIAYYPLTATSTTSDKSGNGHTLSKYGSGTTTFGNYSGVSCLYIDNDAMFYSTIPNTSASNGITQSIWYYQVNAPQYDNSGLQAFIAHSPTNDEARYISTCIMNGLWNKYGFVGWISNGRDASTAALPVTSRWHNVITTFSGTTITLYVDGNKIGTASRSLSYGTQTYISISRRTSNYNRSLRGYVSNAIFENKARTAQEVTDYYNLTKSKYGL